jgi:adenylyltransferase/sulfurtransferase
LILFDGKSFSFNEITLTKNPICPACSDAAQLKELTDYDEYCSTLPASENPFTERTSQITVDALDKRIKSGNRPFILDVREPEEYAICNLDGYLIPLGQLQNRLDELDPSREIIIHCKTDRRSLIAMNTLLKAGFSNVRYLMGGIDDWARRIDRKMPRY